MEKHVPLKKKILRGNHAPFVSVEQKKDIYFKNPDEINRNYISSSETSVSLFEEKNNQTLIFLTLQVTEK